jgi:mannose-1-phosphate guanylyltransferase
VETARRYVESGEFLWNAGIFVFRADVILEAFSKHMPEMQKGLDALRKVAGKRTFAECSSACSRSCPPLSIDYGVMEKATNIAVAAGRLRLVRRGLLRGDSRRCARRRERQRACR